MISAALLPPDSLSRAFRFSPPRRRPALIEREGFFGLDGEPAREEIPFRLED
jgi:hypothetical protein